ncbi:hypothetical protein Q5P01_012729 [Channa striata]|uniref:Uncharacterized protein n=1 Tax=Channa striata TaxID=64152 RepID=A0AA88SRE1_CHASR|nr:hypothetical protein Q5P01_012729 [Channa striata]
MSNRHSRRDRRPDTQQQPVSNKFQNSSAAAKNSHLDRRGMESWACGGGAAGWKMNDRGVEAEQERSAVSSIPYPVTMLSQQRRGKEVLLGRVWEPV